MLQPGLVPCLRLYVGMGNLGRRRPFNSNWLACPRKAVGMAPKQGGSVVETVLSPCRVPWAISPSMSGVTLTHSESDVEPECIVLFGGGRLREDGRTDSRRIEITFNLCYYARLGPHSDREGVEEVLGYIIDPPVTCAAEG